MQSHKRDKVSGKYSVRVTRSLLGISSQSSSYTALVSLSSSNLKKKVLFMHMKMFLYFYDIELKNIIDNLKMSEVKENARLINLSFTYLDTKITGITTALYPPRISAALLK